MVPRVKAFTLRLDARRHLLLRMAVAAADESAQQIVTKALDAWFEANPEVRELADRCERIGRTG